MSEQFICLQECTVDKNIDNKFQIEYIKPGMIVTVNSVTPVDNVPHANYIVNLTVNGITFNSRFFVRPESIKKHLLRI